MDERFNPIIDDFEPKVRPYIHFDLPLSDEKRQSYELSPNEIAKHAFWPLLGYVKKQRRVKPKDPDGIEIKVKEREIRFASHADAALLEYYSKHLSKKYEAFIIENGISACILAYRSNVGDNIRQARSAFDEIRRCGDCVAVAMDISGFFDNIDHAVLKREIIDILRSTNLPDHDHHIFKNMTKFSWVESDQIETRMKGKKAPNGRICSAYQLRKYFRGQKPSIINRNNSERGIPQGTPISGLYANISMISFDKWAIDFMNSIGGSYRRYSDDIALIFPSEADLDLVISEFDNSIKNVNLEINPSKTAISKFSVENSRQSCDHEFQYLGFTFDGSKVLIRSSSLNNYFRKMRRGVYGKIQIAHYKKVPRGDIYLRELYKKYTHYGKARNFVRYAYRSSDIMGSREIKRQLSRHMPQFRRTINEAIRHYYG